MRLGLGLGVGFLGRGRVLAAFDASSLAIGSAATLPAWLSIACATSSRTVQTGPSSVASGFGANAARVRSFDGSARGIAIESSRAQMLNGPSDLTNASWLKINTPTITADAHAAPDGTTTADKLDPGGTSGIVQQNSTIVVTNPAYIASVWLIGGGSGTVLLQASDGNDGVPSYSTSASVTTAWQRFERLYTVTGSSSTNLGMLIRPQSTFVAYVWGAQVELGAYPSSLIPTNKGSRAADVLSVPAPAVVAPDGLLDVTLVFAPLYANGEAAVDHNLLYLDASNRLFLSASTQKLVLRLSGQDQDLQSSALTWSRNQQIAVRVQHGRHGRSIAVSGATSGNGTTSSLVRAYRIGQRRTVYILGDNTGANECADLRGLQFSAAA